MDNLSLLAGSNILYNGSRYPNKYSVTTAHVWVHLTANKARKYNQYKHIQQVCLQAQKQRSRAENCCFSSWPVLQHVTEGVISPQKHL